MDEEGAQHQSQKAQTKQHAKADFSAEQFSKVLHTKWRDLTLLPTDVATGTSIAVCFQMHLMFCH